MEDIKKENGTPLSDTKTFEKALNDNEGLYAFAGGEDCICEFVRTPSTACLTAMRRKKWLTHKNTRFVVYSMFFVILALYAVYYMLTGVYYIGALAGIVALFMLYIVLFGHNYFTAGMKFDEEDGENTLSVKFCTDNIYIYDGNELYKADYTQLIRLVKGKRFIFVNLKGIKPFADGIVLTRASVSAEKLDLLIKKLQNKD